MWYIVLGLQWVLEMGGFTLLYTKFQKQFLHSVSVLCPWYLGLLYTIVEKSTVWSTILAQDMIIWGEGWYAREDEKTINYFIQVRVL